ncbi:MAG: AAA family ATPase [bacterium]|nr:AAA family ATPase [bacterium]
MSIFLKRLELSGFKSFASKTVLEFPAGVVGIVGPNGSGKSNIVDALRWMLGEREAKQLRGEKIENLIFSGTPKKAALGLAQATLCFDNSSHWLPIDFEEVVLTRKVDRSGVSEFFLNQESVRLKDIIELLAKSRLGTKGFTIVNQGQSDIFVKSSPLERQQMIEEIIGLREFQIKKTQSENQLDNTVINLEKIKAMIEEIQPHLRMLQRQTGKWEKRSAFEEELKSLENNYFSFKLAEIKNTLAVLDNPLAVLEKEIRQKQKELENFQGELAKIDELRSRSADLLAKRSECQRELGRLEAKLEILASAAPEEIEYHAKDLLGLIKEIKNLLESSLPLEQLGKLKINLEQGIEKINKFFSVPDKSLENKEEFSKIKEGKEKIIKNLESLNAELSQLTQNEKRLIESFRTVEEKREEINRLENERNKIFFEKEKANLKFQDLEIQLNQIGRSVKEFGNSSGTQPINIPDLSEIERKMFRLRTNLASIGDIDPAVVKEAEETEQRYQFLSHQSVDLEKASIDLRTLVKDLDTKIRIDFQEALKLINKEFENYFRLMFGGGKAKLKIKTQEVKSEIESEYELNGEENENSAEPKSAPVIEEAGIEIELNLPRRRITSLEMLSGGERSLVSMAALFALISVNPPPFLVLDEIDSALDDRNAQRFAELIKKFSEKTQFIIITHNRSTMSVADVLYGITMGEDGVSKILSLKLDSKS